MLRSWRGNCDIQVLIYESDPKYPDMREIAKVTDYVVGYACKGGHTYMQDINQMKAMILNAKEETMDNSDVVKLCRRILNQNAVNRVISKQECMLLLLGLKPFKCSDAMDYISMSGRVLAKRGQKTKVEQYRQRRDDHHLSFHEWFHKTEEQYINVPQSSYKIPHYVGNHLRPVFPPTRQFAESLNMIHQPWHKQYEELDDDWKFFVTRFTVSHSCPASIKIPFQREMVRYYAHTQYVESVASPMANDPNTPEDIVELMQLVDLHDGAPIDDQHTCGLNYGLEYNWNQMDKTVSDQETMDLVTNITLKA